MFAALAADAIVVVRNFPCSGGALVEFGREFGELEPADPFAKDQDPDDPETWLGHTQAHTKKTWGSLLALHTAAAHAPVVPRLHIMLMLDPGLPDSGPDVDSGQSLVGRVDDAVRYITVRYGDSAPRILDILRTTPVSTGFPFPDEPRVDPLLERRPDGRWHFRYWIRVVEHAGRAGLTDEQLEAIGILDEALKATRFDVQLGTGDLIVMDNARAAHGRRPFPKEVPDGQGGLKPTTRRIFNVHVFTDLEEASGAEV